MKISRHTAFVLFVDLLLWVAFVVMHSNERWFHTKIPMLLHLSLWSALLGGAFVGLTGQFKFMAAGAAVAGMLLPVAILVLYALALSIGNGR